VGDDWALDCTIKALTQMTGVDLSAPVIAFFKTKG
jgi:hypothetical protein